MVLLGLRQIFAPRAFDHRHRVHGRRHRPAIRLPDLGPWTNDHDDHPLAIFFTGSPNGLRLIFGEGDGLRQIFMTKRRNGDDHGVQCYGTIDPVGQTRVSAHSG